MPLTDLQLEIARLLAVNRTEDSHLAGGAALHSRPDSIRYSEDLDYFHDSEKRVASAFAKDSALLLASGFAIQRDLDRPGYIRCLISKGGHSTKLEWAYDSAFRFMPAQRDPDLGYALHPIDLAINKTLALAGRDEPRDFLDVMHAHRTILPLGAMAWAACGKDPGFNPSSLLELIRRRGKYRNEDFARLRLRVPIDLQELKQNWLAALAEAEAFIERAPYLEVGCLYYSPTQKTFVAPAFDGDECIPHYGRLGGVLPVFAPPEEPSA